MYYTIYTFSYTHEENMIHYYWEPLDPQKMAEIYRIFYYYSDMKIIDHFTCDNVKLSQEMLEELDILMGIKEHMVEKEEYERIVPIIEKAIIPRMQSIMATMESQPKTALGYATFFDQQWYFPWFEGKALSCKLVSTSLTPPSMLLEWYERQMTKKNVSYKELWERCAALMKKDIPVVEEVEVPSEQIESIEPQKEVKEVGNSIEHIDLYLQLFMEPTTKGEVLLSKVYTHYKKKMGECELPVVTQHSFIKQIRTHSKFNIVRHASGMVITNYGFVPPRQIHYFSARYNAFSNKNDKDTIKIIEEAFQQSSQEAYHREAYFLLCMTTKITPTYPVITWFISDASMRPLLHACKLYLDPYEEIKKAMQHRETAFAYWAMDALNNRGTAFNHRQFFYPFSIDCLVENIQIKHTWNCEIYTKTTSGTPLLQNDSWDEKDRVCKPLLPVTKISGEVEHQCPFAEI